MNFLEYHVHVKSQDTNCLAKSNYSNVEYFKIFYIYYINSKLIHMFAYYIWNILM
jgi:hypothetical protein